MEISIIVPVYQAEQYLVRCVKSILKQTFTDFELILVDDGSPDRCPALCDKLASTDKRIKVIHKDNGGQSSARNAGLEIARGKYIGFVDADDWITPDFYEYLYMLIQQFHADIAMCDYTRTPKKLEPGMDSLGIRALDAHEMQEFFYRIHGEPSRYGVWNCLYKAETLSQVRFELGMINEDVFFTYKVYKNAGRLVVSDRKKYFYFKNPDGITRGKLSLKDFSLLSIWDEIVRLECGGAYEQYAEINRMRATFTLYSKALVCGCDKNFDKTVLKEWRTELRKNCRCLLGGDFLDMKRKVLLFWIILVGK